MYNIVRFLNHNKAPFTPSLSLWVNTDEEKARESSTNNHTNTYHLKLRTLGLVCCLVAAVIAGTNKQTETMTVSLSKSSPPLHIPVTAKWYYLSSFMYFVVANSIAWAYATTCIALSLVTRIRPHITTLLLLILDLIMVALLFTANGAMSFIGLITFKGNAHLQWPKVCGVFDDFCRHSIISVVLSWVGSFVFFSLVIINALNLHKKSRRRQ